MRRILTLLGVFFYVALCAITGYAQPRSMGARSIILDDGSNRTIQISDLNRGIGIGTNSPDPSAILHLDGLGMMGITPPYGSGVNSSDGVGPRGVLLPRMTTAQRNDIENPANGLLIYNIDASAFEYWNGPAFSWGALGGWGVFGNMIPAGGTGAGQQFIGTLNAQDFVIATNVGIAGSGAGERIRVTGAGSVNILTTNTGLATIGMTGANSSGTTVNIGNTGQLILNNLTTPSAPFDFLLIHDGSNQVKRQDGTALVEQGITFNNESGNSRIRLGGVNNSQNPLLVDRFVNLSANSLFFTNGGGFDLVEFDGSSNTINMNTLAGAGGNTNIGAILSSINTIQGIANIINAGGVNNITAGTDNTLTAGDDNALNAADDNEITAADDNILMATDNNVTATTGSNTVTANIDNTLTAGGNNNLNAGVNNSISATGSNLLSSNDGSITVTGGDQTINVPGGGSGNDLIFNGIDLAITNYDLLLINQGSNEVRRQTTANLAEQGLIWQTEGDGTSKVRLGVRNSDALGLNALEEDRNVYLGGFALNFSDNAGGDFLVLSDGGNTVNINPNIAGATTNIGSASAGANMMTSSATNTLTAGTNNALNATGDNLLNATNNTLTASTNNALNATGDNLLNATNNTLTAGTNNGLSAVNNNITSSDDINMTIGAGAGDELVVNNLIAPSAPFDFLLIHDGTNFVRRQDGANLAEQGVTFNTEGTGDKFRLGSLASGTGAGTNPLLANRFVNLDAFSLSFNRTAGADNMLLLDAAGNVITMDGADVNINTTGTGTTDVGAITGGPVTISSDGDVTVNTDAATNSDDLVFTGLDVPQNDFDLLVINNGGVDANSVTRAAGPAVTEQGITFNNEGPNGTRIRLGDLAAGIAPTNAPFLFDRFVNLVQNSLTFTGGAASTSNVLNIEGSAGVVNQMTLNSLNAGNTIFKLNGPAAIGIDIDPVVTGITIDATLLGMDVGTGANKPDVGINIQPEITGINIDGQASTITGINVDMSAPAVTTGGATAYNANIIGSGAIGVNGANISASTTGAGGPLGLNVTSTTGGGAGGFTRGASITATSPATGSVRGMEVAANGAASIGGGVDGALIVATTTGTDPIRGLFSSATKSVASASPATGGQFVSTGNGAGTSRGVDINASGSSTLNIGLNVNVSGAANTGAWIAHSNLGLNITGGAQSITTDGANTLGNNAGNDAFIVNSGTGPTTINTTLNDVTVNTDLVSGSGNDLILNGIDENPASPFDILVIQDGGNEVRRANSDALNQLTEQGITFNTEGGQTRIRLGDLAAGTGVVNAPFEADRFVNLVENELLFTGGAASTSNVLQIEGDATTAGINQLELNSLNAANTAFKINGPAAVGIDIDPVGTGVLIDATLTGVELTGSKPSIGIDMSNGVTATGMILDNSPGALGIEIGTAVPVSQGLGVQATTNGMTIGNITAPIDGLDINATTTGVLVGQLTQPSFGLDVQAVVTGANIDAGTIGVDIGQINSPLLGMGVRADDDGIIVDPSGVGTSSRGVTANDWGTGFQANQTSFGSTGFVARDNSGLATTGLRLIGNSIGLIDGTGANITGYTVAMTNDGQNLLGDGAGSDDFTVQTGDGDASITTGAASTGGITLTTTAPGNAGILIQSTGNNGGGITLSALGTAESVTISSADNQVNITADQEVTVTSTNNDIIMNVGPVGEDLVLNGIAAFDDPTFDILLIEDGLDVNPNAVRRITPSNLAEQGLIWQTEGGESKVRLGVRNSDALGLNALEEDRNVYLGGFALNFSDNAGGDFLSLSDATNTVSINTNIAGASTDVGAMTGGPVTISSDGDVTVNTDAATNSDDLVFTGLDVPQNDFDLLVINNGGVDANSVTRAAGSAVTEQGITFNNEGGETKIRHGSLTAGILATDAPFEANRFENLAGFTYNITNSNAQGNDVFASFNGTTNAINFNTIDLGLVTIGNNTANQHLRVDGVADAAVGQTLGANPTVWDQVIDGDLVTTGLVKIGGSIWIDGLSASHELRSDNPFDLETNGPDDITFTTNGIERLQIDGTNGNVGIGGAPSNDNGAPGTLDARLSVVDDNTGPLTPNQLVVAGSTNTNVQLILGMNTTAEFGSVQAINQGVGLRTLALNAAGGSVVVNSIAPTAGFEFDVNGDAITRLNQQVNGNTTLGDLVGTDNLLVQTNSGSVVVNTGATGPFTLSTTGNDITINTDPAVSGNDLVLNGIDAPALTFDFLLINDGSNEVRRADGTGLSEQGVSFNTEASGDKFRLGTLTAGNALANYPLLANRFVNLDAFSLSFNRTAGADNMLLLDAAGNVITMDASDVNINITGGGTTDIGSAAAGANTMTSGATNTLTGGTGNTITATTGNNTIQTFAAAGDNVINSADDNALTAFDDNTITATNGGNTLSAANADNILSAINNTLSASTGDNTLSAGDDNVLSATDNSISATTGSNTMVAGLGTTTISAMSNTITATATNNTLNAGLGTNALAAINNTLSASTGNNVLTAALGSNTLSSNNATISTTGGDLTVNVPGLGSGNDLVINGIDAPTAATDFLLINDVGNAVRRQDGALIAEQGVTFNTEASGDRFRLGSLVAGTGAGTNPLLANRFVNLDAFSLSFNRTAGADNMLLLDAAGNVITMDGADVNINTTGTGTTDVGAITGGAVTISSDGDVTINTDAATNSDDLVFNGLDAPQNAFDLLVINNGGVDANSVTRVATHAVAEQGITFNNEGGETRIRHGSLTAGVLLSDAPFEANRFENLAGFTYNITNSNAQGNDVFASFNGTTNAINFNTIDLGLVTIGNNTANQHLRVNGVVDATVVQTLIGNPTVWDLAVTGDIAASGIIKSGASMVLDGVSPTRRLWSDDALNIVTVLNDISITPGGGDVSVAGNINPTVNGTMTLGTTAGPLLWDINADNITANTITLPVGTFPVGSVIFAGAGGNLASDLAFNYNDGSNTLTLDNLVVNGAATIGNGGSNVDIDVTGNALNLTGISQDNTTTRLLSLTGASGAGAVRWLDVATLAPVGADYIVGTANATLTNEQVLSNGSGTTVGIGGGTARVNLGGTLTANTTISQVANNLTITGTTGDFLVERTGNGNITLDVDGTGNIINDMGTTGDFRVINPGTGTARIAPNTIVGSAAAAPNSTLQVAGSFAGNVSVHAGTPVNVLATDYVIRCTNAAATVNLPTAAGITGRVYIIKSTPGNTIVQPSGGQTIDGAANYTIGPANGFVQIVSDGANWYVIGN